MVEALLIGMGEDERNIHVSNPNEWVSHLFFFKFADDFSIDPINVAIPVPLDKEKERLSRW